VADRRDRGDKDVRPHRSRARARTVTMVLSGGLYSMAIAVTTTASSAVTTLSANPVHACDSPGLGAEAQIPISLDRDISRIEEVGVRGKRSGAASGASTRSGRGDEATEDVVAGGSGWSVGDDTYSRTPSGESSWSTVGSRYWKNASQDAGAADRYGAENLDRMRSGRAPQRANPDAPGGVESMELSHEPIPQRDGGREFVERWPGEHAAVDPFRYPGYC